MWQGEILAGIAGICGGAVVAVALAAFIIELGIIPRFAGITHTADHIFFIRKLSDVGKLSGKSGLYLSFVCSFGENFCRCYRTFLWNFFRVLDYCSCRSYKCICCYGEAIGTKERDWMDCNLYCSGENAG